MQEIVVYMNSYRTYIERDSFMGLVKGYKDSTRSIVSGFR